jgi:CBS domain-containing protein
MKVEDIMTAEVITTKKDSSIIEVAKLLWKNKIHSLPVIDNENRLIGIVSEMDFFIKDVISSYFPRWLELMNRIRQESVITQKEQENLDRVIDLRVEDIMTKEVVSVKPGDSIEQLMDVFKKRDLKLSRSWGSETTLSASFPSLTLLSR